MTESPATQQQPPVSPVRLLRRSHLLGDFLTVIAEGSIRQAADKIAISQSALTRRIQDLQALQGEPDLDWTFLSPSAEFVEGERSGRYTLGKDHLLIGADGKSWITFADYAIAMLDELEKPQHSRQRFTVGY